LKGPVPLVGVNVTSTLVAVPFDGQAITSGESPRGIAKHDETVCALRTVKKIGPGLVTVHL
jgi:hypothetical protein